MTLIEVIDAARTLTNEPLDTSRTYPDNTSSFWQDSQLQNYVNMVQQDIAMEIVQSFEDYFLTQANLNIVSGCTSYALPANFHKIRRLEDVRTSNHLEIVPITLNEQGEYTEYIYQHSSALWAGGYYIGGNTLTLTETPTFSDTSAVRMHYIKTLADLTAASSVSELPTEHHRILVWGIVRYMLFQQQSDTARADLEFEKHMQKLKGFCENRQVQRTRMVKTRRGRYGR